MRKLIGLLATVVIFGSTMSGCGDNNDVIESSVLEQDSDILEGTSEKIQITDTETEDGIINLSENEVIERIKSIPTVLDVEAVDPNNDSIVTDSFDDCLFLAYFASNLVSQEDYDGDSTAEKGTACGGSVEIFETAEAAIKRDEYLNGSLISMLSPGSHAVKGNIVVRITKDMPEKQQSEFENLVFTVLTTSNEEQLQEVKNFSFSDYDVDVASKIVSENNDGKESESEEVKQETENPDEKQDLEENVKTEPEKETGDERQELKDETEENLTVDNCPELADMLAKKAEIDSSYSDFAIKYRNRIIEFDGRIDYSINHEDYDTRYDYLVSAGDYDPDHQIGPTFKFENVSYIDLHTKLDAVKVGMNVYIIAKVKSFDSTTGLFYLEPVSILER